MKVQESTSVWDIDKCMKIADHVIPAENELWPEKETICVQGRAKRQFYEDNRMATWMVKMLWSEMGHLWLTIY